MRAEAQIAVDIRPWSDDDEPLLERLMADSALGEYLEGTEASDHIRQLHERYLQSTQTGQGPMFVIVVGPDREEVGSIGYWDRVLGGVHICELGWRILPEFRAPAIEIHAAELVLQRARREGKHRFLHAYPAVEDEPANAVCRETGFSLQGEVEIESAPGNFRRCSDWRLDLSLGMTGGLGS